MLIYLKDDNYRQKVSRFMRHNFDRYGSIAVVDCWQNDYKQQDTILSDDVDLLEYNLPQLYLLTEMPSQEYNKIYKYQNFAKIMERFNLDTSYQTNNFLQLIAVTSLVGGAGKSTISQTIAEIISEHQKVLYLNLLASSEQEYSLSDLAFDLNFSAQLEELSLTETAGIYYLNGFRLAEDALSQNLDELFASLQPYLLAKGINYLVLDAGNYNQSQLLTSKTLTKICVRDSRRRLEEEQILKLNPALKELNVIGNRCQRLKAHNHLPQFTLAESERSFFKQALKNYLQLEGLIGY